MLIAIAVAVTASFSTSAREFIAARLHESIPNWSSPAISSYIPVACLAAFLLIAEGWVWLMRLGVHHTRQQVTVEKELHADAYSNASTKTARKSGDTRDKDCSASARCAFA
jgi:MFS superfamily sulfate permease-like transporter